MRSKMSGGSTVADIARLVIGNRGAHAGQDWHDALQLRCRGLADDRLVPEVYSELLNHYTANHKNLCLPVVSFDPDGEPKSVMLCFGCGLCHKFAQDNAHYKTKQHYDRCHMILHNLQHGGKELKTLLIKAAAEPLALNDTGSDSDEEVGGVAAGARGEYKRPRAAAAAAAGSEAHGEYKRPRAAASASASAAAGGSEARGFSDDNDGTPKKKRAAVQTTAVGTPGAVSTSVLPGAPEQKHRTYPAGVPKVTIDSHRRIPTECVRYDHPSGVIGELMCSLAAGQDSEDSSI